MTQKCLCTCLLDFNCVHSFCWLQAEKAKQDLGFNIKEDLELVRTSSPIQTYIK